MKEVELQIEFKQLGCDTSSRPRKTACAVIQEPVRVPEFVFRAAQVAQTKSERRYRRSCQRQQVIVQTYTEAVTVNPRAASKRRLCPSANIRSSRRHAKALL